MFAGNKWNENDLFYYNWIGMNHQWNLHNSKTMGRWIGEWTNEWARERINEQTNKIMNARINLSLTFSFLPFTFGGCLMSMYPECWTPPSAILYTSVRLFVKNEVLFLRLKEPVKIVTPYYISHSPHVC